MKTKVLMAVVSFFVLFPLLASAQGGWVTLPAQACIPKGWNTNWGNTVAIGGESFLFPSGTGSQYFVAPVVFPSEADGLSVRQMNATVGDDDNGIYILVSLYRMNRYSGISQRVFVASSGITAIPGKTVLTDTTGGYRLINSQKYAWFLFVYFSGVPTPADNLRLYAVRIQYQ